MPLSRSPRMDRRRRAIRDGLSTIAVDGSDEARVSPTRTSKNGTPVPDMPKKERGVAYSHSVRRACQHRLVQFIPVRKLSLTGAVVGSVMLPLTLSVLHYLVFVSGTLDWSRHPMSALLHAGSPRSLAAWLCSHLWLLCLAATVLTFRLRKHKLDDYEGEYRLWFWLVFTCIIGSIDSTTRLTELFGMALDRWSQLHVGWSGNAIVQATLATLVGLLGLRLCSELKAVPTSLVLWLGGLFCWAISAALGQPLLKLEMSLPMREWLRASLWLGGLTTIWLSGLFYLRSIFMEAQKRFLSRAVLSSANAVPWRQRLSESMPQMPSLPKFGWRRKDKELAEDTSEQATKARKSKKSTLVSSRDDESRTSTRESQRPELQRSDTQRPELQRSDNQRSDTQRFEGERSESQRGEPQRSGTGRADTNGETAAPQKRRWGFGGLALKPPGTSGSKASNRGEDQGSTVQSPRSAAAQDAEVQNEYGKRSGWFRRSKPSNAGADGQEGTRANARGTQRDTEQAADGTTKRSLRDRLRWSRKPTDEAAAERKKAQKAKRNDDADGQDEQSTSAKRKWLKLPKPKLPKLSMPKPKLPKLKLPSFRLPPPNMDANAEAEDNSQSNTSNRVPAINNTRPLPGTSSSSNSNRIENDNDTRGLSKAERKRLKRLQRDDEGDRRAA